MRIQLKQLTLHNFKGEKHLTISDLGNEVSIMGANATGKTRLFDAFTWCFYGKDSENRANYNIKSLDENNEPLHKTDHTVAATLLVDGMEIRFERTLREKWETRRGDTEEEFTGNETLYKINDLQYKQSDYQARVNEIISEDLFKLLTNPFYFSTTLGWKERREMLARMANIEDQDVIDTMPELKEFFAGLGDTPLELYRAEKATRIRLLKKNQEQIPARIDENLRKLVPDPNYEQVEKEIATARDKLQNIDAQILDISKRNEAANTKIIAKQGRAHYLRQQILNLQYQDRDKAEEEIRQLRQKKTSLSADHNEMQNRIGYIKTSIADRQARAEKLKQVNDKLREDWKQINEETISFTDQEFICPTCKRQFEAEDIEEKKASMIANFNREKSQRLQLISDQGKTNNETILKLEKEITAFNEEILQMTVKADKIHADLQELVIPEAVSIKPSPEIAKLQKELETLEKEIQAPKASGEADALLEMKRDIQNRLEELQHVMEIRGANQDIRERIEELNREKKIIAQEIADLEQEEDYCQRFINTKAKMIEEAVNSQFTAVRFKMFNRQINGGLEETCEPLINGVPFASANNAARINAGIDIINAFSREMDTYAPIFCDNAEAVNSVLKTPSQIIKLYVTDDPELVIIGIEPK